MKSAMILIVALVTLAPVAAEAQQVRGPARSGVGADVSPSGNRPALSDSIRNRLRCNAGVIKACGR